MQRYLTSLIALLKNQLIDQWGQIFLELNLLNSNISLPNQDNFIIRIATKEDIPTIKSDIYPLLVDYGEYDKKYIEKIGQEGMECVIAIKDKKIVHYFFVFDSALNSPLIRTPINKKLIASNDASLGSQFTCPEFRGKSISIYSLAEIFRYLKTKTKATKLLTTIHKNTPSAIMFHKRLGFVEIDNLSTKSTTYKIKYLFFKLITYLLD